MRDRSRNKRSVNSELLLTTGDDNRARSWPKGEDSKLKWRISSSVPVAADVAPWVAAPLWVRAKPLPLRDALCESKRARRSQKSVPVSCFFIEDEAAGVPFLLSASLSLSFLSSTPANGGRGRKWDGKLLANEIRTSNVWRQMMGAAWLWIVMELDAPCFLTPLADEGFSMWNTLARQPNAASRLIFNHDGTPVAC